MVYRSYLNDLHNAPKERAQLAQEILGLLSLLITLKDKVENADPASPWFCRLHSLGQPGGALDLYKQRLDELAILLAKVGSKSPGKDLFWSFDKKRIRDALTMIERLKSLINIALQEDNL